jgi:2-polyprenyl-6-methoxyphenol hydroxylase-like FAD-dependent oxidoreductase
MAVVGGSFETCPYPVPGSCERHGEQNNGLYMNDPREYDLIIVGARAAGAVTALCMARRGYRVLALDRAYFPSDTLSTHIFDRMTVARFARLGLWEEIEAIGAPPLTVLRRVSVEEGVEFEGRYLPYQGWDAAYSVRRVALDAALVRAARAAGAEIQEGMTVTGLLHQRGSVAGVEVRTGDGRRAQFRARMVVGADGRHSRFAGWVKARTYDYLRPVAPAYYAYFEGVDGPRNRLEYFHTHERGYQIAPTDAGLTCIAIFLPQDEFAAYRADHAAQFARDIAAVPELAARFARARRAGPIKGVPDLESYVRLPYGPGWALVGDVGLNLHPITARGIDFAIRDAETISEALDAVLAGRRPADEALDEFRAMRDAGSEMEYRHAVASALQIGQPLPASILTLWSALALLPEDASRFVSGAPNSRTQEALMDVIQRARALVGVA